MIIAGTVTASSFEALELCTDLRIARVTITSAIRCKRDFFFFLRRGHVAVPDNSNPFFLE